jgi:hypothetical protein
MSKLMGYASFGHIFQKLVAASSGVLNPVFEIKKIRGVGSGIECTN